MSNNTSYDYIKKELSKMNISFDIATIRAVSDFIETFIGSIYLTKPHLHIPAAAAIIC